MDITPKVSINDDLIEERFIRASGPGGQHVNKVSTAVQIRFAIDECTTLSPAVRSRLKTLAGSRVNRNGRLVLTANQHRSQSRNREDARERLARLIRRALIEPARRKPQRPVSARARKRRVSDKRRHGDRKRLRRSPGVDDG